MTQSSHSTDILTLEQRAYVVGDQGICPVCEKEKDWSEINHSWFVCNECVHDMTYRPEEINADHT